MTPSRRNLLLGLAAGSALLGAGAGAALVGALDAPPAPGLRFLAREEAEFLRALAGAAWPPTPICPLDGAQAELLPFVEQSLEQLPAGLRQATRLGLRALDAHPLARYGLAFRALDRGARQAWLDGWLTSDEMVLRNAVSSLVLLLGMGYSTHPAAAPAFGHLYRCGYAR